MTLNHGLTHLLLALLLILNPVSILAASYDGDMAQAHIPVTQQAGQDSGRNTSSGTDQDDRVPCKKPCCVTHQCPNATFCAVPSALLSETSADGQDVGHEGWYGLSESVKVRSAPPDTPPPIRS